MRNDFLSKPLDHFIQAEIISKLTASETPIRFSELKEAGIENSLFMYHANKLIYRGLIDKTKDGFSLTRKGARWANYAGIFHDFSVSTPRPLVQFIIKNSADSVLLAKRKGQLRAQINDFLLPGNIYRYGLALDENAVLILQEIFGNVPMPQPIHVTTADVIHTSEDGFVNHVLSHIFVLQLKDINLEILDHPLFTTEWIKIQDIRVDNISFAKSTFLPLLFERLPNIQPHEVFQINTK